MTELMISRVKVFEKKGMGGVAQIVGKVLPAGSFKSRLEQLYNRHIHFGAISHSVDQIIKWHSFEDGMLHIKLNNGLEYYVPQSIEGTKSGNKYMIFGGAYERLAEQFLKGIYERNCQLSKGDTVVDVGASVGFNTVDFSRKVGDEGRVVAIEPHEDSLIYLRKNLELNRCKNVTVVRKGVWSKKDKLKFYLNENAGTHSLLTVKARGKVMEIVEIEVDMLDNILEELGIDGVALIKMDIEGAEIEALKGMNKILSDDGVKLAIASYHKVGGKPTYKTIIPMMEQKGFSSEYKHGISYFAK